MPRSRTHALVKIIAHVGLAYALVFVAWLLVAPGYHLLLARFTGVLVPLVAQADVQRVWLSDNSDTAQGVGAHFKIRFEGKDQAHSQASNQTVGVDTVTVVDIRQFGYPIVTFLALALGIRPPRRWSDLVRIILGGGIIFLFYSVWVLVEVYQYAANLDFAFLHDNVIVHLIPSSVYQKSRIPLIAYIGQVAPISVFAALYMGALLRQYRTARHDRSAQTIITKDDPVIT